MLNKLFPENEKPLENLVSDGGFSAIFRTVACIGDSLAAGEFEATDANGITTNHDHLEHSWGQYIARSTGAKVYNFTAGGMSAQKYLDWFASDNGFWAPELAAQAYIVALGVNDTLNDLALPMGTLADIRENPEENEKTFLGCYAAVLQKYRAIAPGAKFFLVTMPVSEIYPSAMQQQRADEHRALMYALAEKFSNTYVIDLRQYAPHYDAAFIRKFYLGYHMNPMGYLLTAKMIMSYMDYIIRHNMDAFRQVGLIGTPQLGEECL